MLFRILKPLGDRRAEMIIGLQERCRLERHSDPVGLFESLSCVEHVCETDAVTGAPLHPTLADDAREKSCHLRLRETVFLLDESGRN